jgi:HK97 gp10 family phage protein
MSEVGVEIIGLAEFEQKLKALSEAVRGKKLELALKSGALLIQGPAKEKAPVRTGNLRRSIQIETSSSGDTAEARIGTNLVYARIQEFGGTIVPKSKPMLAWKGDDGWHFAHKVEVPAHPYLRPAFDEHHGAAVTEVGKALKILIEKVAT